MLGEVKVLEQPWNVKNAFQGALPLSFDSEPIAVDSFKCRLPLELVKIKEPLIYGDWLSVHKDTGYINDDIPARDRCYKEAIGGTKVKWALETQVANKGRKKEAYLTFSVPAKLLERDYFQGITSNNVNKVYNALMGMNVADFSYEDFLDKSACTDVDFKRDFRFEGNFVEAVREIRSLVKPSKERGMGCRIFTDRMNQGIEFATRETTSFKTAPYLKIYAKGTELLSNSYKFVNQCLSGEDLNNIVRMETTVKNKGHVAYLYGHKATSIKALMMMPQDDKQRAFEHAIACHLEPPKRKGKSSSEFKPMDWLLYNSMKMLLQGGSDWGKVLESLLQEIDCKITKSRLRKKLNGLHTIYLAEGTAPLSPIFSQVFFHNTPIAKSA